MKKFNIISLSSGKIKLSVIAENFDEATHKAENWLNCYVFDEYLIEEAKETELRRERQVRVIY